MTKIYYGTCGRAGHVPFPLDGNLTPEELEMWNSLDRDYWIETISTQGPYFEAARFLGQVWSVYAVPFSRDDNRPGCHSEFWWLGSHTKEEMLMEISNTVQKNLIKTEFHYPHTFHGNEST